MSFPEQIRQQTAASHQQLESLELSKAIISNALSKREYLTYLDLMADVVHDAEQITMLTLGRHIPDIGTRRKLPLILADLDKLGAPKTSFSRVFEGHAHDDASLMGMLYVIEGSTLGGRFIIKNVQGTLAIDEASGASYFWGYGNRTGDMWKTFMNTLTSFEQQYNCADQIISGASFAFNKIHDHLLNGQKN